MEVKSFSTSQELGRMIQIQNLPINQITISCCPDSNQNKKENDHDKGQKRQYYAKDCHPFLFVDTASLILVQLADPQDQCCNGKSQGWQDHPEESDREDAKNHGNDPLLIVPGFLVGTDILPLVSIGPWIPIEIPIRIPIEVPIWIPVEISIWISIEVPIGIPVEVSIGNPIEVPIGIPVMIPVGIPIEVPIGISIKISEIIIHKILSYPDLS